MKPMDYFQFGMWDERDKLIRRLNVKLAVAWYRWRRERHGKEKETGA